MSTEILLIRHGETAWNAVRRLQGHIDIALNEAGLRQAGALAQALADEPLAAIVASDLQRALQTAEAVAAGHRLPVHADPALRERGYGAFEGMLYTEIEAAYPADFAAWQAREVDACMPAGERLAESFRQFYARSTAAIAHWAARYPGQRIAVVAHGGVLECAYRAATGMALDRPRDFQVKNASVNRFVWDGGQLRLVLWGDTRHLAALALDDVI
ncbi:histidine phosphatase family protein [Pseudoduganella violacea]|uniref:Putative phosphoglycerate mutase n=1 Tax=Pseudoduganella violacea TaxID=1715466 RepID=A0A7W5B9P5_9BURK|nr:histidine phosphatase family protein [Pseudoduganella violacea]MBB3119109.1 putative phosphoglycerate mutase [Pseudoduganella violacea]